MENKDILNYIHGLSEYPDWCGIENISIFSKNHLGDSVLHMAASHGRVDLIIYLLKNGLDVDVKGEAGDTPLHSAIRSDQNLAALLLIKMGASLFVKNDFGDYPLDNLILNSGS